MTIAARLRQYLDGEGVGYDAVPHPRATTSAGSAHAAHVPGAKVAKPVVVHHEDGYILAVVPSTHRVELGALGDVLGRRPRAPGALQPPGSGRLVARLGGESPPSVAGGQREEAMPDSVLADKTCTPCRGGVPPLTAEEAESYRAQAPDWSLLDGGPGSSASSVSETSARRSPS